MAEEFSSEDIEEIIQENKDLVEGRGEPFGVNQERLLEVFSRLNSFNHIANKRDRTIKKAAHILAMVAWLSQNLVLVLAESSMMAAIDKTSMAGATGPNSGTVLDVEF